MIAGFIIPKRGPNRTDIEEELWKELAAAQAQYDTALTEFEQIIAALPSDQPSPDEIFRFEKAAVERRLAFRIYEEAMKRFSDFTLGRTPSEP